MPRKPKLTPRFCDREQKWILSIPASVSPDRKRKLERFETESGANLRVKEIARAVEFNIDLPKGASEELIKTAMYYDQVFQYLGLAGLGEACEQYEKRLLEEVQSPTLAQLVEAYLRDYPKPSTFKDWRRLQGAFAMIWERRVGTMDIDFWRDELEATARRLAWKERTYNEALLWLGSLYRHALAQGRVARNPIDAIRRKAIPAQEVSVLLPEQLEEILRRALDKHRPMALYFAVLAFAGVRPVCEFERAGTLTWDNVLWDQGLLRVRDSKNKDKTGAVNRYVSLNPTLRSWLEAFRKETGLICPSNFRRWRDVILTRDDGSVIVDWASRDICRHSFGSYLAASPGVTADMVRAEMGHTEIKTFMRHYRNARTPQEASRYWSLTYDQLTTM